MNSITVVIPTLNEENAIGEVIDGFKDLGFSDILVIDGGSTDKTREIAERRGAHVIIQSGKGKGQAIAEAFNLINSEIAVLIDGDGSYRPQDALKMIEPIKKGLADHVIGNRLANYQKGAFTKLNLIGNKILNFFFRVVYGIEIYDLLSGYRALTREVYKNVKLTSKGFEVETELTVETIAKGFRVLEVPITYRKREGSTKLNPIKDGFRIGKAIYSLLSRYSPARYLYFIGSIFIILGIISGIHVLLEWFSGVTHYLLAILTALFIIAGIQLAMVGLISDFIFRSTVEFKREIISLREKLRKR